MLTYPTPPPGGGLYLIRLSDTHFYGGRAVNFEGRWRRHLKDLEAGNHNPYMQAVFNKHGRFEPEVLSVLNTLEEQIRAEQEWLDLHFGQPGCVNRSPYANGGNGPHSPETRQRMKGRKLSEAHKRALSRGQRRRFARSGGVPAETRRRMSEAQKGRGPMGEETKRRISEAQKGREFSDDHRAKLREAWARRKAAGVESRSGLKTPLPRNIQEIADHFTSGGSMRSANRKFFTDGRDHRHLLRAWLRAVGVEPHSRS